MCNCCFKLCFQVFKQSLFLSYSVMSENFSNWWITETVACNNRLGKLIIENEGEDCCIMICAIIWAIMLARVWGLMVKYISEGADWFEGEVALKL